MEKIIKCPECKYYYPPVCTFHKWLPMTSRKGFCHHAVEGKYEGNIPLVESFKRSLAIEEYGKGVKSERSND